MGQVPGTPGTSPSPGRVASREVPARKPPELGAPGSPWRWVTKTSPGCPVLSDFSFQPLQEVWLILGTLRHPR